MARITEKLVARWEKLDAKPTRRVMRGYHDDPPLVVELTSRFITVRPLGSKRGGKSEVTITASALFDRLLAARLIERSTTTRRKRA